jgi:flagellar motor switch protein FliM
MKEAITAAEEKKFSEFSKKVKTSLEDKLRDNITIQNKSSELKNYEDMRDTFSQISRDDSTSE